MPIPEPLHKPRTDWQFQRDVEVLGDLTVRGQSRGGFGEDTGYFFSRRHDAGGLGGVLSDLDAGTDLPVLDLSSDATHQAQYADPSGWLEDIEAEQITFLTGGGFTMDDTGTPTILYLPPGVYSTYIYAVFNAPLADGEFLNLYLYPADYTDAEDGEADTLDQLFPSMAWGTGTGDWKIISAADNTPTFVETWQRIFISGGTLPWFAVVYPTVGTNQRINDLALRIVKER